MLINVNVHVAIDDFKIVDFLAQVNVRSTAEITCVSRFYHEIA